MWRTPRRKAFTPNGLTHGATVVGSGFNGTGQVWARATNATWWVVTPDGTAHVCHPRNLIVLNQCGDRQLPLTNNAA